MENRKVRLNQHTNLLELEEHMYPLVDVDTPNVFRNLFHYDEIPKIAFNDPDFCSSSGYFQSESTPRSDAVNQKYGRWILDLLQISDPQKSL